MEFLTLISNYNDWLDWITGRYEENENTGPEPKRFPCYVADRVIDYDDDGEALFIPEFLYAADIEKMLEDLS